MNKISKSIESTKSTVDKLYLNSLQQKLIRWLSPQDPSTNYNKALRQRHKSSGLWLLRNKAFVEWKIRPSSTLWLQGIPGCGKTILSSSVIEHLLSAGNQPLLYFFFDFNNPDKQSLESVVRSLIIQLYYAQKDTQQPLDSLFASCKEGETQPSCESLCKLLSQMIEKVEQLWIVLDALDECRTRKGSPTEGLLSWIRHLVTCERKSVHLLVTSRPEQDIRSGLSDLIHEENNIVLKSNLVSDDIGAFIHTKVREEDGLKRWQNSPEIQNEIITVLMQKANGM